MQLSAAWLGPGLLALAALAPCAANAENPADGRVAAVVAGERIFESDLDSRWEAQDAAAYQRSRRDVYDARRRVLDEWLADRLLDREARRQGVSRERLLEHELARRTQPVSEEDVAAFVADAPLPATVTPASVSQLVSALLQQRARDRAREVYVDELRQAAGADVVVHLEPPRVAVGGAPYSPVRGSSSAPVSVVVFSDFECPFCRRAAPVLNRLAARFPTEVAIIWRHYPLSVHPHAGAAAEAAQCAHDQGRFWEFHDAVFAETAVLERGELIALAARLGLDKDRLSQCLDSGAHADDVRRDTDAGSRAGVSGTPTVFINGIAFVGALPYETYERAVREELRRSTAAKESR